MLLTTQYLDEAEHLADRIAILHGGRIIQNGTLDELRRLLPPARVEYVEKQPSLEDVFLALVGEQVPDRGRNGVLMSATHAVADTAVLTGRSLRHILRSPDTIITTAVTPIAMMLLFVYVLGGAIETGSDEPYVTYLLPGILLMTIASGVAYTSYRLFLDLQGGIVERFQSMPIGRSAVLWGHVLTSLVANAVSVVIVVVGRAADGLPVGRGRAGLAGRGGHPAALHRGPHLAGGRRRTVGEDRGRRERVQLPADLPAVHQLGVRPDRLDAGPGGVVRREPARHLDRQRDPGPPRRTTGRRGPVGRARLVPRPAGVAYAWALATYRRRLR